MLKKVLIPSILLNFIGGSIFLIFLIVGLFGISFKTTEIERECQPTNYKYDDFGEGTYCVSLYENVKLFSRDYSFLIFREGNDGYGYFVSHMHNGSLVNLDPAFSTKWSQDGVQINVVTDDYTFIPAKNFRVYR